MLNKVVEKYDGLTTFIINTIVQILEFVEIKSKDHPVVYNINLPREIFVNFSAENIIEMCFTIINVIYKTILKHPKFSLIKKYVIEKLPEIAYIPGKSPESNFSKIFLNEMVIDKFILFIGIYSEGIFYEMKADENNRISTFINEENTKHLSHILEYLFNCLNYNDKAQGLAYQASNTIKTIFDNTKGKLFVQEFLNNNIYQMINLIEDIQNITFFEILESLVGNLNSISHVYDMVKALIKRILKEIKSNKQEEKMINIYVSKCFNIIESIIETHVMNNTSDKIPVGKMEEELKDILLYIKNPSRIDFEDDILRLTYKLLQKSEDITESSKLVFDYINRVISNHGCIKRETFDFIHQLISKQNTEFLDNEKTQKELKDIVLFKDDEDDFSSVFSCIIMQIWILVSLLIINLEKQKYTH